MSAECCDKSSIADVIPIAKRFFAIAMESGVFSELEWCKFWEGVYEEQSGCLLIEKNGDGIVGFFGLIFTKEPWTGDISASEICWYSESKNGLCLLRLADKIVRLSGAKEFYIQNLCDLNDKTMNNVYKRFGFKKRYNRFQKEL